MAFEQRPAGRDWRRALKEAAPLLGLGTTLAVSVGLGLGAGYWLDRRFGTAPYLFLAGGIVGIAVAGVEYYKLVAGRRR